MVVNNPEIAGYTKGKTNMCFKATINDRIIYFDIIQGDITKQNVDAIVNAAHESLLGGGGVDGAIHRAAGPSLLEECQTMKEIEPGIRCKIGQAYITKAGNLQAKHVIHTVAPKFIGYKKENNYISINNIDNELENCYINPIKLAIKNNIKTIAFPSLGTGGHSYPIELAAPIAIKSTIEALKENKEIKAVLFICFSKEDYHIYLKNMMDIIFNRGEVKPNKE